MSEWPSLVLTWQWRAIAVRHYYYCCAFKCDVKRYVTFAAEPVVLIIGAHNHDPPVVLASNTPVKKGKHAI